MDGITDSMLQPVKYTITGFSHLMENFHNATNYIANIIDNKKAEYSARDVSSTTSRRGCGRGFRERGRAREGARNQRGGGRGMSGNRNNGRGGGCNNNIGRWISAEEWNGMSEDDKEIRREAKANHVKQNISFLSGEEDKYEAQDEAVNNAGSLHISFTDACSG